VDLQRQNELLEDEVAELREKVRSLEALIAPDIIVPIEWGLTGKEGLLLSLLVGRELVSKDYAIQAMYALNHDDDIPDQKIVDVFVCKIRKKLTPFGVTIHTVWGKGYTLDQSTRQRLKSQIRGMAA
jgi:two-component system cell cycle response regulator CtrA